MEEITNHLHSHKVDSGKRLLTSFIITYTQRLEIPVLTFISMLGNAAVHYGEMTVSLLILFTVTPYRILFPKLSPPAFMEMPPVAKSSWSVSFSIC